MPHVEFDKDSCIGAGTCAAVYGAAWVMDGDKANLKSSKFDAAKKRWVLTIAQGDVKKHTDAAKGCPAGVIHVFDDAGKKLA